VSLHRRKYNDNGLIDRSDFLIRHAFYSSSTETQFVR